MNQYPKSKQLRHHINKFNAKRAESKLVGRWFDSTAERDRGEWLWVEQQENRISELEYQPKVNLVGVNYRADFKYKENGRLIWEDIKGAETERFSVIKQLWALHGPGPLRIVKRKSAKSPFRIVREIMPIT